MHRNTGNTESLIVEYGFIDDPSNNKFLNDNYKQLAEAVIQAIADYKGIPYTPPYQTSNTYIVKKGDSLYSIASRFNTTVDTIKSLNNLTSNTLSIGQILKIPESLDTMIDTNNYIVKNGDTLYSIANKFNTTVNNLKSLNNLTSNSLSIGQNLLLPADVNEIEIPEEQSDFPVTYTVQNGDTLYSIANKYGTTVSELKLLNNLTDNNLNIGQVLTIATTSEDTTTGTETYTVKSGDTIYSIANKYGISANDLKNLNNLTGNLLRIGQLLTVPTSDINIKDKYTVQSGDTLYSIANKYSTTVDELKSLNNLTSNTLSIGQVLEIK